MSARHMEFDVNHPPTMFISSGLSMLSALLIVYLYILHKHLRTLFFNTFALLVSLGAFQFIVLVARLPCYYEGLCIFYILTLNNCITVFIIWLLYAFVKYGKTDPVEPCSPTPDVTNNVSITPTSAPSPVALQNVGSTGSAQGRVSVAVTPRVMDRTVSKKQMLGNQLCRQLAYKNQLGNVHFELTMLHKVFWFCFVLLVPLAITFVGFVNDIYGPWTPWCFIMLTDQRVMLYHGQVFVLWAYYAVMFMFVCKGRRHDKGGKSGIQGWQAMALKSFMWQLLWRLLFMTVSLTRCSNDWAQNYDSGGMLKVVDCEIWCYFVGFCTPLSLSVMPVVQWLWIHRDVLPFLFCNKETELNCFGRFWRDKHEEEDNAELGDVTSFPNTEQQA